jgi:tetratricopeptide (TPR) repeat protein
MLSSMLYAHAQDTDSLLTTAVNYIDAGSYDKAINIYTRILAADPVNDRVHTLRGDLLSDLGRFEEAIASYDSALLYTGSSRETILVNRAVAKRHADDAEGAVADLREALTYNPDNITALVNLGALLPRLDMPREAIDCLEKVIRLDSTFEGGYCNLTFLYSNLGEYGKALDISNRLLSFKPDEAYALNNRGFIKYKMNDLEGALEDINNSISLLPGNSFAFKNRALIYAALKRKDEACADFQKALNLGFAKYYGQEANKLVKAHCKDQGNTASTL